MFYIETVEGTAFCIANDDDDDMATIRHTKSISRRTLVDDSKFLEMDACFTAFDKDG